MVGTSKTKRKAADPQEVDKLVAELGLKDIKKDKYGNVFGNLLLSCIEYEFFGVCVTVIHCLLHPLPGLQRHCEGEATMDR